MFDMDDADGLCIEERCAACVAKLSNGEERVTVKVGKQVGHPGGGEERW